MTEWNFLTIAVGHPKWYWAARRLNSQAKRSELFASRRIARLDAEVNKLFKPDQKSFQRLWWILRGAKALDSYRWKPILIHKHLISMPEGSGLLYLDAGCELNINEISRMRMFEYFELTSKKFLVTMALETSLFENTSDIALTHFDIDFDEAKKMPMNQSGIIFIVNNEFTRKLIGDWASTAIASPELFVSQSKGEPSLYRIGRHDQSILSCLMLKIGINGIPDETYFGPNWNMLGSKFPIWAIRNSRITSKIRKPFPKCHLLD
jgi:hypothetical protein